jgi:hypothetical protein
MITGEEVQALFRDEAFRGSLLFRAAQLEFDLGCLLCAYFIRADRYDEAMDGLLRDLPFGRKIEIAKRLPLNKTVKSYGVALTGLVAFQRLRNVAAHQWSVSLSAARQLLTDARCRAILDVPDSTTRLHSRQSSRPDGLTREYRATSSALSQLVRTKEVGVGRKRGMADPAVRALIKVMSSHL